MLFIYSALPLKICSLFRKTIICVMIFTSATLILFGRASCDQILIWLWFIQKCQSQVCTSDDFLLHMSCQIISECYGNLFINFLRLYVRFGSPFCLLLLWLCQVHLRKIFSEGKKTRWKNFSHEKKKTKVKVSCEENLLRKKHLHYLHNFISCLGIFKLHLENSNIEQNKKKQRLRFLGFSHYPYITLSNLITSSSTVSSPHLGVQIGSRPLLSRR